MPDLIDSAVNKATAAAGSAAAGAAAQASAAAGAAASAVNDQLAKLPMDKDPDIIKRQAEAKVQQAKALAEDKVLKLQETAIEDVKKKLNSLRIPSLPIPPKLPLLDPKILGAVALLKQAKALIKKRKKMVKKNLEDGRKLYKYDIKKVKPPTLPSIQIPSPPTLPNVPRLPTL